VKLNNRKYVQPNWVGLNKRIFFSGGNGISIGSVGCNDGVRFVFQLDEGIVARNELHAEVLVNYFMEELELVCNSLSQQPDSV